MQGWKLVFPGTALLILAIAGSALRTRAADMQEAPAKESAGSQPAGDKPAATEPTIVAGPDTILTEEEVTRETLRSMFRAAFFKCTVDDDGDLRIEDVGIKVFVRVHKDKKLISLFSAWGMKASVSEAQKLAFVNRLNDKVILVRFCMPKPNVLWCDYQLSYEEGLYARQIIATYRLFTTVVKGAALVHDPDDIIGQD